MRDHAYNIIIYIMCLNTYNKLYIILRKEFAPGRATSPNASTHTTAPVAAHRRSAFIGGVGCADYSQMFYRTYRCRRYRISEDIKQSLRRYALC